MKTDAVEVAATTVYCAFAYYNYVIYMLRRIYEIADFMNAATLSPNTCNRQFGYQIHEIGKY
jgi:hypothetical protein